MDLKAIPRLAPGCRLHPADAVLLVPEGALNLQGPARDVLAHVDGKQNVEEIVTELLKEYEEADHEQLQQDVLSLLVRLQQRGVVRL